MKRRISKIVRIGNLYIGGDYPIRVQSMLKVDTRDTRNVISEIKRLEDQGCEIIRLSVKDRESAMSLKEIKRNSNIPIVADIHFDPTLAILSIENGADKIRLNPSNIKDKEWIKKITLKAKERETPIRVGANLGSFTERPKNIVEALVETALNEVRILENFDFDRIVISIKSSDIITTIKANVAIAKLTDYAIHVGITEAGPLDESLVKSGIGIGYLLLEGIGDTIRVSVTGDPVYEIRAAYEILKGLHLRQRGIEIVSCPMCGRTEIDISKIVERVKKDFGEVQIPVKVAIMGCVVNGPGEAKDADIGIAGGKESGVIFKHGKRIKVLPEKKLYEEFKRALNEIIEEKSKLS